MSEPSDLTRRLVEIPSHEDETDAGDEIETWLREETDADVTRDDAGNVRAWRRPNAGENGKGNESAADAGALAFVGHHDVVPPADEQTTAGGDYVVREEGDRLYGRGTADMKGAVAAMLLAFRDAGITADTGGDADARDADARDADARDADARDADARDADAGTALNRPLGFASFVGEETGGRGARFAIEDGFDPAYAVVGEGSTGYSSEGVLDVAVAHRGRRASTVTASGTSAHASEPDAGENAVYRACDAVDVIRDLDAPSADVLGETLSGSVAVTEIEGGTAWNVIPDECAITVDERTVPGERAGLDRVEAIEGVSWSVDQDLPPMACDDAEFADSAVAAVRAEQDGVGEQVSKPHATDAGWLAAAGVTCLVCGPAERGEAHTATESVSLPVLDRCRRVYERLATA